MSADEIHPTAIVAAGARLGQGVRVGPYAVIGAGVHIGARTVIGAHAVLDGNTAIGEENHVFPFASIGQIPQDLKYHGEDSELRIGDRNTIREMVTLNPGTEAGGGLTRVGNDNLLMNYVHVAHDCIVGDRNIIANGVQLGGHVVIQDSCVVGALSGIHQFVRIGESAMVGAGSMVSQDVPAFCNATGDRARLHGLNRLGLQRRGFPEDTIKALRRAYRTLFQRGLRVVEAVAEVRRDHPGIPEVERLAAFVEQSERGVCR